ncbi:MAG: hypothetical protein PF436_08600 [Prolixibacteraceae bacterium]|jgi:formiminoglutamase|nr:hypothetical protein [Prolixibacteraceae bacterium]
MFSDKIKELLNYFSPVELNDFSDTSYITDSYSIGNGIAVNSLTNPLLPSDRFEVAIFTAGKTEPINTRKNSTPQQIREQFYHLKKNHAQLKIADLGNLKTGTSLSDMLFAIHEVCSILFNLNINIVVLSDNMHLIQGITKSLKQFETNINLTDICSQVNLDTPGSEPDEKLYLNNILTSYGSHIYNITSLAYQSYFTTPKQINYLNNQYFEHYRLGVIRKDIKCIEPVFRDSDIVNFNISSIRIQDAPMQKNGSPNGLHADEACQLSRYAGISDKTLIFHFFGNYPSDIIDQNKITSKLVAQMIWYYIDGYQNRKHEYPKNSLDNCKKYEVQIDEIDFPIVFYKSYKTERWWIEIKPGNNNTETNEPIVASCTEKDYKNACTNEIPERWWMNFKKTLPGLNK